MRWFDISYVVGPNKLLDIQPKSLWFEPPWHSVIAHTWGVHEKEASLITDKY